MFQGQSKLIRVQSKTINSQNEIVNLLSNGFDLLFERTMRIKDNDITLSNLQIKYNKLLLWAEQHGYTDE